MPERNTTKIFNSKECQSCGMRDKCLQALSLYFQAEYGGEQMMTKDGPSSYWDPEKWQHHIERIIAITYPLCSRPEELMKAIKSTRPWIKIKSGLKPFEPGESQARQESPGRR